jgi:pentatricopeptide repeat protein
MASLIPGYEYDIFISYRQKDNKYDGWVNEFVDHLKREIEATFKEDVSIYFDENPHDGLLEIHNVDKSLENKLKSVVFIPIISQTYCDPRSFAWLNEFVAFNKKASADQIGRDVKLASGNVCSRIIPVKINDLDATDTELIETEMGCRLRSIDFIFSSAGVNRPLKPMDNPDKNLNKTYYRDQINKVANAVKDVIYGIHPDPRKRTAKSYQTNIAPDYTDVKAVSSSEKPSTGLRVSWKFALPGLLGIILIAALIIFLPKLNDRTKSEPTGGVGVRKVLAVMPVTNLTGNPDLEYICLAIQDDIIGHLQTVSSLTVRPRQTTQQFSNSKETYQQIARKLSIDNIIEASIRGSKENLKVEVHFIEAFPEEKYVWNDSFNQNWNNISEMYPRILNHIVLGTGVKLTAQEAKNLSIVQKHDTALLNAYRKGVFNINLLTAEGFEKGIKYLNDAMAIDPTDPLPYVGLALGYSNSSHAAGLGEDATKRAKKYAQKALELDSTIADAHVVLATTYLYKDWDIKAAELHLKLAIEYNPNSADAHIHYGWLLCLKKMNDEAISEMKKAFDIDPTFPLYSGYLSWLYLWYGQYDNAIMEAQKTLEVSPGYPMAYYVIGSAYTEKGMFDKAFETFAKLPPQSGFESGLGIAYAKSGRRDEALKLIDEMKKMNSYWYTWAIADVYSVLGDKDNAIYWIDQAYKQRHDFFPWFRSNPYFKGLFNDPRFIEITGRIEYPQ